MNRTRVFRIVIWVVMLLAVTTTTAWAAGESAPVGQEGDTATDALWTTLAPIIAIATTTERILEMFWERWESSGVWPNKKGVQDKSSSNYIMSWTLANIGFERA